MQERRLGRGLDGLLQAASQQAPEPGPAEQGPAQSLDVGLIDPNPYQPRQEFPPEELEPLRASILEHGVLQPIVVRPQGERYQVIAGERRFRACQASGLATVPAVVREVADDQMLELALVENLQREDLDPIEKATSFRAYLERSGMTQEKAAGRLGLDRSTIANMVRLLELPDEVQTLVRRGLVAMGHARALLSLGSRKRQLEVAERIVRDGLSVRQVEMMAAASVPASRRRVKAPGRDPQARDLEARLREALGTKVTVVPGRKAGTGRIVVDFYSSEDLDRILARLG